MAASTTTPVHSILLVEDDPDYSSLLREAFSEAGFEILEARNGEKALQLLRDQKVNLVISDFMMPELNGLELCRLVANDVELSHVRVILYSCNTDALFRRKARELGALEYLPKTEDVSALVRQICDVAGLAAARRQDTPESNGYARLEDVLQSVRRSTCQLTSLINNLLDFIQIAAVTEASPPPVRVAWDAARRIHADIQRVLGEIEKSMEQLKSAPGS